MATEGGIAEQGKAERRARQGKARQGEARRKSRLNSRTVKQPVRTKMQKWRL